MTIHEALQIARRHHQAGRLPEAEGLYRQVLAIESDNAEALGLLGALAGQLRKHDLAIQLFHRAIAANPTIAEYHMHLGQALHESGEFADAAIAYARGVELKPDCAEAYNNLGLALRQLGKHGEAEAAYSRAIELNPTNPDAYCNLGIVLADRGKYGDSIAAYSKAIALHPSFAEAHCNIAAALNEQGKADEAIAAYSRALEINPNYPEAHNNLGIVLNERGKLEAAIAEFSRAIEVRPQFPAAFYNLGNALRSTGKLEEAVAAYQKAIELKPTYAEAYNNLGGALMEQARLPEAINAYLCAIGLRPTFAEAFYNLGTAYNEQGRYSDAIAVYTRAIELRRDYTAAHQSRGNAYSAQGKLDEAVAAYARVVEMDPDYAEAHNMLGNALKNQGKVADAIACYERAMALKPSAAFHSNLVFAAHFHPDYDAARIHAEARRWSRAHADPLRGAIEPHLNDRDPRRRLKIGYISPDFHMHPVGRFIEPLLRNHDHERFEIHCYADVPAPDQLTQRVREHADVWRSIVGMSGQQVARLIREDGIDILVELSLHTGRHRLLVLARKPAPVQISYLGYCSTTGMETIDYRLSDVHIDPPGSRDEDYSEQTIRLPDTYWCYEPGIETAGVNALPALESGRIMFGCLNNFGKVSAPALATWCRLLQRIPDSRLMLSAHEGSHRKTVSDIMERGKIDPARIVFAGRIPLGDYFRLYHSIDIALDPFPFAGGTTTCDALWMGVPLITLAGKTAVGRAGVSLLANVGLSQWVAESEEAYVDLAAELAGDIPRLAGIRGELRPTVQRSPLMNARRFAGNVETAYRKAWERYCEGENKH